MWGRDGGVLEANRTALKANTEAMNSNIANLVELAAVEPVPMEQGTSARDKAKWGTATVPSEPFGSRASRMGAAGCV